MLLEAAISPEFDSLNPIQPLAMDVGALLRECVRTAISSFRRPQEADDGATQEPGASSLRQMSATLQ
jgi:hypothetical protein